MTNDTELRHQYTSLSSLALPLPLSLPSFLSPTHPSPTPLHSHLISDPIPPSPPQQPLPLQLLLLLLQFFFNFFSSSSSSSVYIPASFFLLSLPRLLLLLSTSSPIHPFTPPPPPPLILLLALSVPPSFQKIVQSIFLSSYVIFLKYHFVFHILTYFISMIFVWESNYNVFDRRWNYQYLFRFGKVSLLHIFLITFSWYITFSDQLWVKEMMAWEEPSSLLQFHSLTLRLICTVNFNTPSGANRCVASQESFAFRRIHPHHPSTHPCPTNVDAWVPSL